MYGAGIYHHTLPQRLCSVSSLIFAWTVVKSSEVRYSADSSSKAAAGEGLMESAERRGDESGVIAPTDSRRLRFREAGGLAAEMPFRQAPPALPGAKIRVFVLTTAASGAAATGAVAGAATGAATTDAAAGVAMAALSLQLRAALLVQAPFRLREPYANCRFCFIAITPVSDSVSCSRRCVCNAVN